MPRTYVGREVDDFVKTFLAAKKSVREDQTDEARQAWYHQKALKEATAQQQAAFWSDPKNVEKYLSSFNAPSPSAQPAAGGAGAGGGKTAGMNAGGGWWTPERIKYATNYLETKGGLSKYGAAGLVARWAGVESADKGPASLNEKSGAWGVGQWLGPRKHGIQGNDSFDDQLRYAVQEGQGSEKAAWNALRTAKNYDEGARGASMYERAEGYDPKTGLDNYTHHTPVKRIYTSVYGEETPATATAPAPRAVPDASAPVAGTNLPVFARQPMAAIPEAHEEEAPDLVPFAADGGMIAPQEAPQAAPQQEAPLETALDGALQALQATYNLKGQAAAIPGADEEHQRSVAALNSNERAVSPEAMQALIERTGSTDEALRQIYSHFASQGDKKGADEAAMGVVQAARQRSMEFGQHAMQALHQGDFRGAADALIRAYDEVPDGNKATGEVNEQGVGKAVVTNGAGKVVDELPLNPQTLAMLAQKFTSGAEYYGQLARYAKPSGAPQPQGEPQQAVKAFAFGGLADNDADDGYRGEGANLLASADHDADDTFSRDMASDAYEQKAQAVDTDTPSVQTAQATDTETPSAVPVGGSAGGPGAPQVIPVLPGMPKELVKHIEALNKQRQWDYQHQVSDADISRRAREGQAATDRRAAESRAAADERSKQTLAQREKANQERIKASQDLQEKNQQFRLDQENRKDPKWQLQQGLDEGFKKIKSATPGSDEHIDAFADVLDAGAAYADVQNKNRYGALKEGNFDTDESGKPGRITEYKAALKDFLASRQDDATAKRADGSPMTDVTKANVNQLDKANEKRFLNLVDGVAARNSMGKSPDALVGALYTAAFGIGAPMNLDRKTGRLVIGDGVDRVSLAVNGDEFRLIAAFRKKEKERLSAAIDDAKKKQASAAEEKKATAETAQRKAVGASMQPSELTPDQQYAVKYGLTPDASQSEVDSYINRGMR